MSSLATTTSRSSKKHRVAPGAPDARMPTTEKQGVLDLASVSREDIKAVGTKAALLGELHAANLPAAPGLVVCTQTCTGLRATRTFTPGLLEELETQVDKVLPNTVWFAIRSSAVEGARVAEQNQPDTQCEYFVPRDALAVAIIATATAPTDRPSKRAVLVQPMVPARVSGTVFSDGLHAGTAANYLIESCWGLGRALVAGQTDPDRYQLDHSDAVIEQQRGRKQHQIKPKGTGLLVAVNEADRLQWTLTPEQLKDITTLTKGCAKALGGVQDIEFAVTEDAVVLLQSRPVIATKLVPENDPVGRWLIFLPQLASSAEPLTPLAEDLLRPVLPDIARLIHGRVYLDFDKLSRRTPLVANDAELSEAWLFQQDLTRLPLSLSKALRQLPFWLSRAPWALQFWARSRSLSRDQLDNFWNYSNDLANDTAGNRALNARQLFERFVRGGSVFAAPWRLPVALNATSSLYLIHIALLHRLVRRWTHRELNDSTLQQLCTSNTDTLSHDMVADILDLGRKVAQAPELKSAFAAPLNGSALHQLLHSHPNPAFIGAFSAFIQRYGHRGANEFELASPRWHEEPDALLAMIGIAAKNSAVADGYDLQLLARDDLHQAIGKRWQRRVVDHLLRRINYYLSLRENTRHYAAKSMSLVRQRLLQLEDRLLQENKLKNSGDLFFLSWNDLQYLDNGQLSIDDACTLIAAARDQHAERCSNRVRMTLGYDTSADANSDAETVALRTAVADAKTTQSPNKTNHDIVTGHGAAPGCADGIARVVTSERELADFQPGEVLVLAFADPTMVSAVQAASAVVCERGHAMSSIGTLAREWGVPFLIGATNCTRAISTGERVRVNANNGWAEVLAPL